LQLAYLDESQNPMAYYITALVVSDHEVIPLSKTLDEVTMYAQDTYGGVQRDAELHGHALVNGRDDSLSGRN
jgi:hypothetical protein